MATLAAVLGLSFVRTPVRAQENHGLEDMDLRLEALEQRLDRLGQGITRAGYVTRDELRAALEANERSVESLRVMISHTDAMLERVLKNLEAGEN